MRRERLPNWILKYKRNIRAYKLWGVVAMLWGFNFFWMFPLLLEGTAPWLTLFINPLSGILFLSFGFAFLISTKIKYRKIDDYYICHYVGWKNRLIIDGEEEDSSVMGKCYGTLPDGREVESGGLFGITFKVTDPQTGRTRRL